MHQLNHRLQTPPPTIDPTIKDIAFLLFIIMSDPVYKNPKIFQKIPSGGDIGSSNADNRRFGASELIINDF